MSDDVSEIDEKFARILALFSPTPLPWGFWNRHGNRTVAEEATARLLMLMWAIAVFSSEAPATA